MYLRAASTVLAASVLSLHPQLALSNPLVARASGPCPMTRYDSEPCRDLLDSSACWNGIIGPDGQGGAERAERLWDCVPGGKEYVSCLFLPLSLFICIFFHFPLIP